MNDEIRNVEPVVLVVLEVDEPRPYTLTTAGRASLGDLLRESSDEEFMGWVESFIASARERFL